MGLTKTDISIFDNATEILKGVEKGALFSTEADGKKNAMTISWGSLGIEWGKPIVTAYIRESRFTRELLAKNAEFAVSIPLAGKGNAEIAKKAIAYCGKESGRDGDKIAACGLTSVEPSETNVGGYAELPLTLECRVIYQQEQDSEALPEGFDKFYPPFDGLASGRPVDCHCAFYGEIVAAYVIE